MATSPQSTLYVLERNSSFSSSNCSPDRLSIPFEQKSEHALDLLYATADLMVGLGLAENRCLRKPDRRHFKPSPDQFHQMRYQLLKKKMAGEPGQHKVLGWQSRAPNGAVDGGMAGDAEGPPASGCIRIRNEGRFH